VKQQIQLRVNGETLDLTVEPTETLLEVLRGEMGLHGVRETCGLGLCGTCTVLIDDRPISACLTLAVLAQRQEILTIEGLARDGQLDPIQEAFIAEMSFQCSYCTPGFILTTRALLAENPNPTQSEMREYLAGNLCRCGSYLKILAAVELATKMMAVKQDSGF